MLRVTLSMYSQKSRNAPQVRKDPRPGLVAFACNVQAEAGGVRELEENTVTRTQCLGFWVGFKGCSRGCLPPSPPPNGKKSRKARPKENAFNCECTGLPFGLRSQVPLYSLLQGALMAVPNYCLGIWDTSSLELHLLLSSRNE